MKLQHYFILSLGAVLLIPFAIASIFSIYYFSHKVEAEALQKLAADLNAAQLLYADYVEAARKTVSALSREQHLSMLLDLDLINRLKKELIKALPDKTPYTVAIFDAERQMVVTTGEPSCAIADMRQQTYLERALKGETVSGTLWCSAGMLLSEPDGGAGRLIIAAAGPVMNATPPKIIGAYWLQQILGRDTPIFKPDEGYFSATPAIYGPRGHLVSSMASKISQIPPSLPAQARQAIFDSKTGFETVNFNKGGHLLKAAPLRAIDGGIAGALAVSTQAGPYIEMRDTAIFNLILIFLIGGILAILVGSLLSRIIVREFNKALQCLHMAEKGDLKARIVPLSGNTELGTLQNGINQMIARIEERDLENEKINAHLKRSLEDKKMLLQELYHRTKNNLQVIHGLLTLQASQSADDHVTDIFRTTQDRIMSMALIHQKLYQSKNVSHIDLGDYVRELAAGLLASYGVQPHKVALEVSTVPIPVNMDQGIACGLILNELISNCLKHAFPDQSKGRISLEISLNGHDTVILKVQDNGVGLPPDMGITQTGSLGMQLIHNLVQSQLDGTLKVSTSPMTEFVITFRKD